MNNRHTTALLYACIFIAAVCASTSASAQTGSRLLARTYYYESSPGVFGPQDSSRVLYPNNNTDLYSEDVGYYYSGGAYARTSRYVPTYNSAGKMTQLLLELWNATTSTYDKYRRTTYTLDAAGNVTSELYEDWNTGSMTYVNNSRISRTYNANNRQLFSQTQTWRTATSTWRTTQELSYVRDGMDNLITAVSRRWNATTGNLSGADSNLYVFNTANRVTRSISYSYNLAASAYRLNTKDTTFFNAAGDDTAVLNYRYNAAAGTWDIAFRTTTTRTMNSAGRQAVSVTERWVVASSSFVPDSRLIIAGNTYGQQTLYRLELWDGSVWKPFNQYAYYYELYNNLGIQPIAPQMALNVSPNPASDMLTATMQWSAPQDFAVMITDMQGRIHQRHSRTGSRQSTIQIPVHGLPAGNYLLSVKGASGAGLTRIFTVRH